MSSLLKKTLPSYSNYASNLIVTNSAAGKMVISKNREIMGSKSGNCPTGYKLKGRLLPWWSFTIYLSTNCGHMWLKKLKAKYRVMVFDGKKNIPAEHHITHANKAYLCKNKAMQVNWVISSAYILW